MHFTRDPIIETIITPREGHRLVIRHISQTGHEEFVVDMLEVISLGNASFFRSLDKPKPFIVPVAEYEVLEVREQRMVLKAPVAIQKGIKIAGGHKEPVKEIKKEEKEEIAEKEESTLEPRSSRRNRRSRKRGQESEKVEAAEVVEETKETAPVVEKPTLIPPPPLLISETMSRYKGMSAIEELAFEDDLESVSQDTDDAFLS
jgi:hypothetical protein